MRSFFVCLIVLAACACDRAPEPTQAAPPVSPPPASPQLAAASLTVSGRTFLNRDGRPFEWRGITAFRLAEMVASGHSDDVVQYLDWARSEQVTVVRVLLMAQHLFKLPPAQGVAALPQLLDLANARGLFVEVVVLADTRGVVFDITEHIRSVGKIAAEKGNAFVEIANEPGHPTQDSRVHDPAFVAALAALIPDAVPVSLGSIEYGDGYGGADYVTFHAARGTREWDHVTAAAEGARLAERFNKPVISDEPIGAGATYQQGRRDNEPARFAAEAALTELAGLGATFHYEGGLHAVIPGGREAECFRAWRDGLSLVRGAIQEPGEFLTDLRDIATVEGARAAYARLSRSRAVVVLIDPSSIAAVGWTTGWTERKRSEVAGVQLRVAER
ncbi:MAG: hypothetical protein ABIS06_07985 [Vicinamibacterales bacterium]